MLFLCPHTAKRLDSDLFPWLLEEFPYLHLAPATLHNLWRKESLQLEQLSRADADVKRKKSKAQEQVLNFRFQILLCPITIIFCCYLPHKLSVGAITVK